MEDHQRYSDLFFGNPNDSGTYCADMFASEVEKRDKQMDRWVSKLKRLPKVRLERVRKIKAEIENGTYYSEDKWSKACQSLLEDLRDS